MGHNKLHLHSNIYLSLTLGHLLYDYATAPRRMDFRSAGSWKLEV